MRMYMFVVFVCVSIWMHSFKIFKWFSKLPVVKTPIPDKVDHYEWVNNMLDIQYSFAQTFLVNDTVERSKWMVRILLINLIIHHS